ncbi:MAG TPA: DUF1697 domain-containing protein [Solirubrobacterales bacterium]
MARYVAFLRGMNLGGRRIANDDLRSHFEALGCEDVATFRASGNVIFARDGRLAALTSRLEEGLAEALGYEVPVFLRSAKELLAIAARELYWLPAGGISESDLDWQAIEAALGPTTVRTKGTIDQIATKHLV